jgi:hypothetical protein
MPVVRNDKEFCSFIFLQVSSDLLEETNCFIGLIRGSSWDQCGGDEICDFTLGYWLS